MWPENRKALKEPDSRWFLPWAELDEVLPPTYAVRQELILEAMNHPHAHVRSTGYRSWKGLPKPVARTMLVKGLADLSPQIRCECIHTLADDFATVDDLAVLRAHRARETDRRVLETLDSALRKE